MAQKERHNAPWSPKQMCLQISPNCP